MPFLEEYDAIDAAQPQQQMGLFFKYILTDPGGMFEELRAHRPILVMPSATLATRFVDVQEILTRPKVFSVRLYAPKMDPSVGPFMLARDATAINRRDKSIMMAMLRLEDLPAIKNMVAGLADAAIQACAGTMEVVSQLARLVPVQLTDRYFGFPGPDTVTMMRWSRATQYDMFHNTPQNDPAVHAANLVAGAEMRAYLTQLIAQRRTALAANPSLDDTVSRLLKTVLPDVLGFDDDRIISNVSGLLVGGVETTSAAVVQALDQLLARPQQFAAACAAAAANNDELFAQYVWEALRFRPINPFVFRFCEQDYELAADTERRSLIKAGTVVLASTTSAMMDDGEVDTPEEFRLGRPDYQFMHLGYGHHTCLGDQISLVQVPTLLQRLLLCKNLRRAPGNDGQIDFRGGPFPESFVVQFDR